MLTPQELPKIVRGLLGLPTETECVEFKENRAEADDIGEYISALANSAALHSQDLAFIVWGVTDVAHRIVGTSFRPRAAKKDGEDLENYLIRKLDPRLNFKIHEVEIDGHPPRGLRDSSRLSPAFRISKPYAADYRIGMIEKPLFRVALAVAASSAFPPVLSPVIVALALVVFKQTEGADLFPRWSTASAWSSQTAAPTTTWAWRPCGSSRPSS